MKVGILSKVLAIAVASAGFTGMAAASGEETCFFRPGDIWVLSGDSITFIGLYRQTMIDALDHFHPGHGIRVMDTSKWGQLTNEAKGKGVEYKPAVVSIMLGMNNVIHHDYAVAQDFSRGARNYGDTIRRQVRQYQALGAEVVLMQPTLTDETENSFFGPWNTKRGLEIYGEEIRRVAAEEHCRFVPVAEEFEAAKRKLKAQQTFITDGVHPYGWGQYEIARSLIHHLNVDKPFAKEGEPRGFNARPLPAQDFAFRAVKRFAAEKDEAPSIGVTAPESVKAKVRWSVERKGGDDETSIERGEIEAEFKAGEEFVFTPAMKKLPWEPGRIARVFVSVTPAKGAPRMAVVDLARVRVVDFTKGVYEEEVKTDRPREEGPVVGRWKLEEDGPDLWLTGHTFAKTFPERPKGANECWMNSSSQNGLMVMLDLRPSDRFADNDFDRDMHMVMFSVIEKPWSSIALAWEGRTLQNALYSGAVKTADGYDWRLGIRGFTVNYRRFDVRRFDHFGINVIFDDANDKGQLEFFPAMEYPDIGVLTPERRLNQTIVIDRKGDVPRVAGETTNVGVYAL